jgi:hypothetical protein
MVWTNPPLVAYHGTVGSAANQIVTNGPDLAACNPKRDFDRGFYMTRNIDQAIRHANDRYKSRRALYVNGSKGIVDPLDAAVLEFTIGRDILGNLSCISFVLPSDEWREFVIHCRAPGTHRPAGTFYDVAFGPVSTNRYTAWPNLEQLSFHTQNAIGNLGQARVTIRGRPTI